MEPFLNISAYRFTPMDGLKPLRACLLELCLARGLKGTILLSTEGINLFVSGADDAVYALVAELQRIPGLESLQPKESRSGHQPFTRMLVRIKKEIIAFGVEGIDPARRTSPKLPPRELKAWLDEGRPITLLDTRNDYEIKLGTFDLALPIGVKHFRDFPAAAEALPAALKEKPLVMFCTGGIRCEKAGPYLESRGFKNVFQLDGGILKYFEECGSAHFHGDCFVFDQRVGVDPNLHETPDAQCFVCLTPLVAADQQDARYLLGKSCPYCFVSTEARMRAAIDRRHGAIANFAANLPGRMPTEQRRPLKVPERHGGGTAMAFLNAVLPHISSAQWEDEFRAGRILGPELEPIAPETIVQTGDRCHHVQMIRVEPDVDARIRILYEDEAVVVISKSAPLPVHPCGRYHRNTLQHLLEVIYAPQKPHPAHRLDANTTGLMLVARTRHFAGLVQPQFSRGEIEKKYLARVHGHPTDDRFVCDLALGEQTAAVGAREADVEGLAARTEFQVLARFPDDTTLLEVRPITGRTNQIRIHLWELGLPIVGDPLYLPGRKLGDSQTSAVEDSPLCLHSSYLSFIHPVTRERRMFADDRVKWKDAPELDSEASFIGKISSTLRSAADNSRTRAFPPPADRSV